MKAKKTIIKRYNSIAAYLAAGAKPNLLGTYYSVINGEQFTGTNSYEEAKELAIKGWDVPLQEFKKAYSMENQKGMTENMTMGVEGFAPCVPMAVMGLPYNMFTFEEIPSNIKQVTILYKNSIPAKRNANYLVEAGKKLLALIAHLHKKRIQTRLISIPNAIYTLSKKKIIDLVTIKEYSQQIEIKKLCFPLAHTSWVRRIAFSVLETLPELQKLSKTDLKALRKNYGYVMQDDDLKKELSFIPNSVYLSAEIVTQFEVDELMLLIDKQINNTFAA